MTSWRRSVLRGAAWTRHRCAEVQARGQGMSEGIRRRAGVSERAERETLPDNIVAQVSAASSSLD